MRTSASSQRWTRFCASSSANSLSSSTAAAAARARAAGGSGSGVIIAANGYIVTNNHVIDKADKIEVVLDDKRKFEAELVGADPTTDLAAAEGDRPTTCPS